MESHQGREQQLTIFYSGSVCIFDNVPADRAKAVMQLLSEDSSRINSTVPDCGNENPLMPTQKPVAETSKASFSPLTRQGSEVDGTLSNSNLMPTLDAAKTTRISKNAAPTSDRMSQADLTPLVKKACLANSLKRQEDQILETMQRCEDAFPCMSGSDNVEMLGCPCWKRKKPS